MGDMKTGILPDNMSNRTPQSMSIRRKGNGINMIKSKTLNYKDISIHNVKSEICKVIKATETRCGKCTVKCSDKCIIKCTKF